MSVRVLRVRRRQSSVTAMLDRAICSGFLFITCMDEQHYIQDLVLHYLDVMYDVCLTSRGEDVAWSFCQLP